MGNQGPRYRERKRCGTFSVKFGFFFFFWGDFFWVPPKKKIPVTGVSPTLSSQQNFLLPKISISHTKMLAFRRKALAKPEGAQGHTVGELDSSGQTPK